MKIFVSGLHRAGTHSFARYYAKKYGVPYLEEGRIKWDSLEAVIDLARGYLPKWEENKYKPVKDSRLDKGFSLQCPGLAHKVLELSHIGKVYWCSRDHEKIVTSMVNAGIHDMAWYLMKGFRDEFSDDQIWQKIKYNGRNDPQSNFSKFYILLVKVKEYFYQTRFKDAAERVMLENLKDYDVSKTLSAKKMLKPSAKRKMLEALSENESLRFY